MNNSPQRAAKGFTRAFWVSNTVELFERMAYYAVFIVLTIYLSSISVSYTHLFRQSACVLFLMLH